MLGLSWFCHSTNLISFYSTFNRLFGIKCAKCTLGFSSSDLVMRARGSVYHIECFRCSVCSRQLLPGDEFSVRDEELFCRADHGLALERGSGSPLSPGHIHSRGLHMAGQYSTSHPTDLRLYVTLAWTTKSVMSSKGIFSIFRFFLHSQIPDFQIVVSQPNIVLS